MLIPPPGTKCDCGQVAVGFHPYSGYCCAKCKAEAQAAFNKVGVEIPEPRLFSEIIREAKLRSQYV